MKRDRRPRSGEQEEKKMKKAYSKPTVEMIVFDYREQVTASGGGASGGWGDNGGGASGGW